MRDLIQADLQGVYKQYLEDLNQLREENFALKLRKPGDSQGSNNTEIVSMKSFDEDQLS